MLDHKAIAFKLECEPEYLLTFLDKKEVEVRIEAISLLHKLCANKEIQQLLLLEHHFNQVATLIKEPLSKGHPVEIRTNCFQILKALCLNPAKAQYKQLLFKSGISSIFLAAKLTADDSDEVRRAVFQFLIQLAGDPELGEIVTLDANLVQVVMQLLPLKLSQELSQLAN